MKKITRVIAAVMTVCLVFACTACGGASKSESAAYYIGATAPLTGDASSYGISVQQGASLAVDEINAAGGLNGVEFKLDVKDDKATPEDAATGYNALFDAGMQVALGSITSGSCEAFANLAVQDNLFFITPSASAASVIADRPNAFRVCFGDPDQGILAAEELTGKYSNIGCIYDTSDPYSAGVYDAFSSKMAELGVDFVTQTFDKENNKDFSTQVEALKDCDVIFLPFYYTEAGLVAKACVAKGVAADLFGCDGFDGIADMIDETVTNSIRYITPFDVNSTDEKTAAFVKAYTEKYGSAPDQFAADGYDAVYAIFESMKAAGVNDASISASDLCDAIVAAITDPAFSLKGVTGTMVWDESGACTKIPVIVDLQ